MDCSSKCENCIVFCTNGVAVYCQLAFKQVAP